MIIATGHGVMSEGGLTRFSAREVAKRIGYSVGTIYNVFASHDALIAAINSRTFALWVEWLRAALEQGGRDRIEALVRGYFSFARAHPQLWHAIYDHHLPDGEVLTAQDLETRGALTELVVVEVAAALDQPAEAAVQTLARSLVATVHGHCAFALSGAWALMGEAEPETAALARVREALAAA